MSLKVANIRLELDEPEAALPEKLSARLGIRPEEIARWRIVRKSLDARRHDDLHFVYAAEVELPEHETQRVLARAAERAGLGWDVEPYRQEPFTWHAPGTLPLEHRPVIVGAG